MNFLCELRPLLFLCASPTRTRSTAVCYPLQYWTSWGLKSRHTPEFGRDRALHAQSPLGRAGKTLPGPQSGPVEVHHIMVRCFSSDVRKMLASRSLAQTLSTRGRFDQVNPLEWEPVGPTCCCNLLLRLVFRTGLLPDTQQLC